VKKFLTLNEAAARLRVHPDTLKRAVFEGKIKAVNLGGKRRALRFNPEYIASLITNEINNGNRGRPVIEFAHNGDKS